MHSASVIVVVINLSRDNFWKDTDPTGRVCNNEYALNFYFLHKEKRFEAYHYKIDAAKVFLSLRPFCKMSTLLLRNKP